MVVSVRDSRPGAIRASYVIKPIITLNDWNYFVFTYKFNDPANLALNINAYINGVSEAIYQINPYSSTENIMGKHIVLNGKSGADSRVSLDEISLFDGVLTPSEAAALYQMYQ